MNLGKNMKKLIIALCLFIVPQLVLASHEIKDEAELINVIDSLSDDPSKADFVYNYINHNRRFLENREVIKEKLFLQENNLRILKINNRRKFNVFEMSAVAFAIVSDIIFCVGILNFYTEKEASEDTRFYVAKNLSLFGAGIMVLIKNWRKTDRRDIEESIEMLQMARVFLQ